jgi:hypothetical protein
MKIAVCISGHLRDGDKLTYPALKQFLLDKYDCDVFLSSWVESGVGVQFVHHATTPLEFSDVTDRLLSTYKPVHGNFHIERATDGSVNRLETKWKGIVTRNGSQLSQNNSMFRKIYDADHLRIVYSAETGTTYDAVVRLRFDTELVQDIVEPSIKDIEIGNLIVRTGHMGIIDQIFWGRPDVMTAACECFLYVPRFVTNLNSHHFENAENILATYFSARQISLAVRDDIKFSLTKPHGRAII